MRALAALAVLVLSAACQAPPLELTKEQVAEIEA